MIDRLVKRFKRLHMVGIGGSGMCGIAEVLLKERFTVSGSDMSDNESIERLRKLGALVHIGHDKSYVKDAEVVVYSSAVREDHVELVAARDKKIPVIRRSEMLAELMRLKVGIAISGAHGKTTTTSLVGEVLTEGKLDPSVIVGGRLHHLGGGVQSGQGEFLVTEADEYDQSFLRLTPAMVVITNLDNDHLECYENDYSKLESAFVQFANSVPFYGRVVVCIDEPSIFSIMPRIRRPIVTYGFSPNADVRGSELQYDKKITTFKVTVKNQDLGVIRLPLPGKHNVLNALAAVSIGLELGIDFIDIKTALEGFQGVHRRFEIIGEYNDIMLVTDFAHHPSEVRATLAAAKSGWNRPLVVLFQPHLFSRTQMLAKDFGQALLAAETAVALPIYPAREEPIPGVTSKLIIDAAKDAGHKNTLYFESKDQAVNELEKYVNKGDMVLIVGAGDIYRLKEQIINKLSVYGTK